MSPDEIDKLSDDETNVLKTIFGWECPQPSVGGGESQLPRTAEAQPPPAPPEKDEEVLPQEPISLGTVRVSPIPLYLLIASLWPDHLGLDSTLTMLTGLGLLKKTEGIGNIVFGCWRRKDGKTITVELSPAVGEGLVAEIKTDCNGKTSARYPFVRVSKILVRVNDIRVFFKELLPKEHIADDPYPITYYSLTPRGFRFVRRMLETGTKAKGRKGKPKRYGKRGRPADRDPKTDARLFEAWQTGGYKTYADLAQAEGISRREVELAIDRHRHREKRRRK